jgi:8-oxo-dGTP pyrophosphatase MutT (NUDIX family)
MKELLAVGEDCFSRTHFQPGHFTASAFVLSPDRESVLLILHGKLGLWLQPGGHIDPSDVDVVAAARREVIEETGIEVQVAEGTGASLLDVDIHAIPANPRKSEPSHDHFDLRFTFVAPSLDFHAGSDALAARWVRLEAVVDAGTDDSVRRAIRKLTSLG